MLYLDNAATTLIKPAGVHHAVMSAMSKLPSAGRGSHRLSLAASRLLYECRETAADFFHMSDPSHVVFTFNATHALNIAIRTLAHRGSRVLISGYEHNAVTRPLTAIGAEVCIFGKGPFDPERMLDELKELLPSADLVICTHVSNVFGYILPVERIAGLCGRSEVPLIIDASQSAGILDLDFDRLGAEFVAMPGHKALFGPQGTGLLLCKGDASPFLLGGAGFDSASPDMPDDLPERLEAGTMNTPGIAGLQAGMRFIKERGPESIRVHEQKLIRRLAGQLIDEKKLRLFLSPGEEQCGILSFQIAGKDSETVCEMLDERGIAVRGGLHCAPLAHRTAGTFQQGTVRISVSPFVDAGQIDRAARSIRDIQK